MTHNSSGTQAVPNQPASQFRSAARSSARLAHEIGDLILEKLGDSLVVIDVEKVTSLAELIVIANGRSKRQILAMADAIHAYAKERGFSIVSEEGREQGWWVLVDFGDVIVHLMHEDARSYYDLDMLWGDGVVVRRVER